MSPLLAKIHDLQNINSLSKHEQIVHGIIGGYYIISEETNVTLKVALILFAFHSFQEDFYNTFRKELGEKYHIDIFFHHNNFTIFKTITDNISRKYGMYVIAPIQIQEASKILKTIPSNRLLLVDRFLKMPDEYSYITQEFKEITYNKLVELITEIKKYDTFQTRYRPAFRNSRCI